MAKETTPPKISTAPSPPAGMVPPPAMPPTGGGSWLSQHKGIAIAGGIVAVLAVYLLYKHMTDGSSSSSSSTTVPSIDAITTGTESGTVAGQGEEDYYQQLESLQQEIDQQLQDQVSSGGGSTTTSTTPSTTTPVVTTPAPTVSSTPSYVPVLDQPSSPGITYDGKNIATGTKLYLKNAQGGYYGGFTYDPTSASGAGDQYVQGLPSSQILQAEGLPDQLYELSD